MSVSNPTTADRLRWICNTSIEEGKAEIKRLQADPDNSPTTLVSLFQSALEKEQSGAKRATLVTALSLAIIKAQRAAAPNLKLKTSTLKLEGGTTEVVPPSWDRARQLLAGIKLYLRISLAGQVMLGAELQQLKRELGFVNHSNAGKGRFTPKDKTWAQHVKDELDLSDRTADQMIACWEAAKAKLKKLGGQPALLAIMDTAPASLTAVQRQTLEAAVSKVTDGETQKSLLEELRIVKVHVNPTLEAQSAGGKSPRNRPSEHQLAWDFAGGDVITELSKVRTGPHFKASLMTMPLSKTEEVPFGLIDYVAELEATLTEAKSVLATRVKS